jgi:hypothetical protein
MAELFQTTKQNVFEEGELQENSTVTDYLTVQTEGKREVQRNLKIYNLDVIISANMAKELAESEYEKYRKTRIEIEDVQEMKKLEEGLKKVENKKKKK